MVIHPSEIKYNDRILRARKYGANLSVSASELLYSNMTITQFQDRICDELHYRITATIYGEDVDRYTVITPATWWDHLKHDHAPNWFKLTFPVKYRKQFLSVDVMFPQYRPPRGMGGEVIRIRELESICE